MEAGMQQAGSGVYPKTIPQARPPRDTALASHINADGSAVELATKNLDRLKRLRTRLLGVSDLKGEQIQPTQPHPDGAIPRLEQLAAEMQTILNDTSNVLDQLDGVA